MSDAPAGNGAPMQIDAGLVRQLAELLDATRLTEVEVQDGDRRIRVEALPENRGISAAMNATIARARGRYLAILNSDDWALPGRLQKQVAFLDDNFGVSYQLP